MKPKSLKLKDSIKRQTERRKKRREWQIRSRIKVHLVVFFNFPSRLFLLFPLSRLFLEHLPVLFRVHSHCYVPLAFVMAEKAEARAPRSEYIIRERQCVVREKNSSIKKKIKRHSAPLDSGDGRE